MTSFTALQAMDIIIRMETALAGDGNLIVLSLKKAIKDNQPATLIIKTTQEMIHDNVTSMQDILGVSLVERIKNFESMKIKIEIKNRFTGSVLFQLETEDNTIKQTLIAAVKEKADLRGADLQGAYLQGADLRGAYLRGADLQGADLRGADLQGAYLQGADLQGAYLRGADLRGAYLRGADLQGAYLRGADLQGAKIKTAIVFTGLYDYIVIPYITEEDVKRVKMGCYDRSLEEWDGNFWNNNSEFPNDGSVKSNLRLMAFETAKKWFEIISAI